jgi:hypothetical protein
VSHRAIRIDAVVQDATSLVVVRVLGLHLLGHLIFFIVVVLSDRPLLATLSTLAALLRRLRGTLSGVIGVGIFGSSLAALLAAVERAGHLSELGDAMGDSLSSAIYQKESAKTSPA